MKVHTHTHDYTHMQTWILPTSTSHASQTPLCSISRIRVSPSASVPLSTALATISPLHPSPLLHTGPLASTVTVGLFPHTCLRVPSSSSGHTHPTPTPHLNLSRALFGSWTQVLTFLPTCLSHMSLPRCPTPMALQPLGASLRSLSKQTLTCLSPLLLMLSSWNPLPLLLTELGFLSHPPALLQDPLCRKCSLITLSFYLFIDLASPGLSCGTWDLHSALQHVESFNCHMWDLVPWPGIEPGSPA